MSPEDLFDAEPMYDELDDTAPAATPRGDAVADLDLAWRLLDLLAAGFTQVDAFGEDGITLHAGHDRMIVTALRAIALQKLDRSVLADIRPCAQELEHVRGPHNLCEDPIQAARCPPAGR